MLFVAIHKIKSHFEAENTGSAKGLQNEKWATCCWVCVSTGAGTGEKLLGKVKNTKYKKILEC